MTESFSARIWLNRVLLFSPVAVALAVMLPRLLSPQFGLLDDGVTLRSAHTISQDWLSAFRLISDTGRFFPVYWWYYALIYQVGGISPFPYFAANYLALAGIAAGVIGFVRYRGGSRFQAWAAGMFLVLSGPTIETYYTLSKPEVPQLLSLVASLLLITRYTPSANRQKKLVIITLTTTTLLLALLSKETSLAMLPISIGWLMVGLLKSDAAEDKMDLATRKAYLLANLLAVGILLMLRAAFTTVALTQGSYTAAYQFEFSRMLASMVHWGSYLIRDFPYLIPFGIFAIATFVFKAQRQARLVLDTIVWMIVWMGIFLPWHSLVEYYLMPFALGCAIFSGVVLGQAVNALQQTSQKRLIRVLAGFSMMTCLIMFPVVLANNSTNAHYQLTLDRANSELVDYLATLPEDSTVLINLPTSEYVYELGIHLANLKDRADIRIDYFRSQIPAAGTESLSYYVVTPWIENQLFPSVRYGAYETGAQQWDLYLQNFLGGKIALANFSPSIPAVALGDHAEPIQRIEHQMPILDFGLHLSMCIVANQTANARMYCNVPRPIIDNRTLSYGWKVYQAVKDIRRVAQPGMYSDGTWELLLPNGEIRRLRFGQSGDKPLVGDWDGDGFSEIGVFDPNDLTWKLDENLDGQPDIKFQVAGMMASDIPIVGDWDGNGTSTPGFFRPTDVSWHLRNSNSNGGEDWPIFRLGLPTDSPVVGDWDGDGRDTIGIYRLQTGEINLMNSLTAQPVVRFFSIPPQSIPVVADWAGNGSDSITAVTGTTWLRKFVNCNCEPSDPNPAFEFGDAQDIPVAGNWKISQ